MRKLLARVLITAFGLWIADVMLDGVSFDNVVDLWIAAVLLGLVNAVVRPIVIFLTLPITFVTLGLFLFVVNGLMVLLVHWFMPQFHIQGLGTAIWTSIIVGLTGWVAGGLLGDNKVRVERIEG